jgi:hypothetical protein
MSIVDSRSVLSYNGVMRNKSSRHFRVVPKAQYFRLTHLPSGDYVQRHLCDFLTRRDAIECRDRIIAAAPDWDWSNPTLFTEMGGAEFQKVWSAIYSNRRAA